MLSFVVHTLINDLTNENIQPLKIKNVGKLYFMSWKQLQKEKKGKKIEQKRNKKPSTKGHKIATIAQAVQTALKCYFMK